MTNISFGFENPLKIRFGESFFKDLPKEPGVYIFTDVKGQPLYVGKAGNLKSRLMSYQRAKPGSAPDHILEMIEHAVDLRFELKGSSDEALKREEELIRSIRPPYNVTMNWDVSYLYIAFKSKPAKQQRTGFIETEFRLSHFDLSDTDGFTSFGCFRHRGKAKVAYSALLRLLFAAYCPRERFQLPSKLCRTSPAYIYSTAVPENCADLIEDYLAGRNSDLLRYLLDALLSKDPFPKQLYLPMQRDLEILKQFFIVGPQDTAAVAKRLRRKNGRVPQEAMDALVRREFAARRPQPLIGS